MAEPLRVLLLFPREHSYFLRKTFARWVKEMPAEECTLYVATVGTQLFSKKIKAVNDSPVHDFGYAGGGALLRCHLFMRRHRIQILHTFGESALYFSTPLSYLHRPTYLIHSSVSLDQTLVSPDFRKRAAWIWRRLDLISFPHPNVRDAAVRDLGLRREATVVAPFGLPPSTAAPAETSTESSRKPHLVVVPLKQSMRRMPPSLRLALYEVQRERTDCAVHFRHYAANPKFGRGDYFNIFLLLADGAAEEVIWQTVLHLVSENRPFILIGGAYVLPPYLPSGDLLRLSLHHPRLLRSEVLRLLRKSEEFYERNFRLRKALSEAARPSSTREFWHFRYQHMRLPEPQAGQWRESTDPFPDEAFYALLRCPECQQKLELTVEQTLEGRAESGSLSCAKGHQFRLHRGIVGFHEDLRYPENQTENLAKGRIRDFLSRQFVRETSFESTETLHAPILRNLRSAAHTDARTMLYMDGQRAAPLRTLAQEQLRIVVACDFGDLQRLQDDLMDFPNVRFVHVRRDRLPFQPGVFDLVYLPEGNFDAILASPVVRHLRALLKPGGRLHLQTYDLPFFWRTTPEGEYRVRAFAKRLPLGVSKYASRSMALLQEGKLMLTRKNRLPLAELERHWFRLLAYPDFSPVTPQVLRLLSQDLDLSDVQLETVEPLGFHLSGANRER